MSATPVNFSYPENTFLNAAVTKDVVANMNKEDGLPYGVLTKNDTGFTMEVNDTSIVKSQVGELKDQQGKLLPVGAKIFFNEDGSLKSASYTVAAPAKATPPKSATRTAGSYERPQSRMLDRQ